MYEEELQNSREERPRKETEDEGGELKEGWRIEEDAALAICSPFVAIGEKFWMHLTSCVPL